MCILIKTIKKTIKAAFWGFITLFSPDMALESCRFLHHPCDRFQEPDPEEPEPTISCPACGEDVVFLQHEHCSHCHNEACVKCMYHNTVIDEWFCISTGPTGLAKGQVESECMAEYLKVAEVIISRKE